MTKSRGILGALPTLEERVVRLLAQSATLEELVDEFTERADRQRVVRRRLLSAALQALRTHFDVNFLMNGSTTDIAGVPTAEFFAAIRDFECDVSLLDAGRKPDSLFVPVDQGDDERSDVISSERRDLLGWITAIRLWDVRRDQEFKTKQAVYEEAARALGKKDGGVIKTQLSHFETAKRTHHGHRKGKDETTETIKKPRFTQHEIRYAEELEGWLRHRARSDESGISPFGLLIVALRALNPTTSR